MADRYRCSPFVSAESHSGEGQMQDKDILAQIQQLVEEEHALLERGPRRELSPEEHAHLNALEVSLDQAWDLLRQRRAKREFGDDPNDANVRDASTVERFQQ